MSKRRFKKESEKLIEELRAVNYWREGLLQVLWRIRDRQRRNELSELIKVKVLAADKSIYESRVATDELFETLIGKAVVSEN